MVTLYDHLGDLGEVVEQIASPPSNPVQVAPVIHAGVFGDEHKGRVVQPRPYQIQAVQNLFDSWSECNSSLIVMATGLGKTVASAWCMKRAWEELRQGTLFIAHREELVDQTVAALRAMIPGVSVGKEQAESRSTFNDVIVVASKDTLWRETRLREMGRNRFGKIFVDEAHHYIRRNKTYHNIIDYFGSAHLGGLTATPDRSDEVALGDTFESVAFVYEILDGIRDGYLVKPYQRFVFPEQFDLECFPQASGDFTDEQAAQAINRERTLESIVQACCQYSCEGGDRQTIVFCPSVSIAERIAELLNDRHDRHNSGRAAVVSSKIDKDDRKPILKMFRERKLRYLTNYGVLTEGVDLPDTSLIVNARITKSRQLYAQMVGRGLRPLSSIADLLSQAGTANERHQIIERSGKRDCWVIDLAGVSSKHKLTCLLDVLGGRHPDTVADGVRARITQEADEPVDVVEEMDREADRVEFQFIRNRSRLGQLVKLGEVEVDCFDVAGVLPSRRYGWDTSKPATPRQLEVLSNAGVSKQDLKKMDFSKASSMIDAIVRRREQGLCTYKQAKKLISHGYSPDLSFEEASRIMDRISQRGWVQARRK